MRFSIGLMLFFSIAASAANVDQLKLTPIKSTENLNGLWIEKGLACVTREGETFKYVSSRNISNRLKFSDDFTKVREIRTATPLDNDKCYPVDNTVDIKISDVGGPALRLTMDPYTSVNHVTEKMAGYKCYLGRQLDLTNFLYRVNDEDLGIVIGTPTGFYDCYKIPGAAPMIIWEREPGS